MEIFHNRTVAGQKLAKQLQLFAQRDDVIVLALPRGGVPVAFEIAQSLHLPLDIYLVRKIGVPWQEELAMGAIALGGIQLFNNDIIAELNISKEELDRIIAQEQQILEQRNQLYRGGRSAENLAIKDRVVILVDDGIATGATMRAAIQAIKKLGCKQLVLAVPVAPKDTLALLAEEVDQIVCLQTPSPFFAIGNWYDDFSQVSDEVVIQLLAEVKDHARS